MILFNSAEFFKAHEVWEELWLTARETDKLFLQGMIQLAAAFHHYTRGNLKGTKSLLEAGLDKLRRFPGEHRGANLNALCGAADGWLETVTRGGSAAVAEFPQIELAQPGRSNSST
ncbi:MAG TPA: DUF309 domain-containing protein [Candidatus Acidoferrales bacterium]|nr:DUF309 domain-containing protein [Candidatus Acidoferrales bacterium]